jgi:hypothetical protein
LPTCVHIQAPLVDQAVSRRVLEVFQPEQVQIALEAVQALEARQAAVERQWRLRLERLEYQAQLAQRRYELVDPALRLVAATLEQRWNAALQDLQRLKDDYQTYRQQEALALSAEQKAELLALAQDLPRWWQAPTTSAKDRKRMLRLLVKDVTVEKRAAERKARLHLRWQGGAVEDLEVELPLPPTVRFRYAEAIVAQVRSLAAALTDRQIAARLNEQALRSAKGQAFTQSMIQWIRYRYGIAAPVLKRPGELTVKEVACHFQISTDVVHYWIQRGQLTGRKLTATAPYWITLNPEKEIELKAWIAHSHHLKPKSNPKSS